MLEDIFHELVVELDRRDIQACHQIKATEQKLNSVTRKITFKLKESKNDRKISMILRLIYQSIPKLSLAKVFVAIPGDCGTSLKG